MNAGVRVPKLHLLTVSDECARRLHAMHRNPEPSWPCITLPLGIVLQAQRGECAK